MKVEHITYKGSTLVRDTDDITEKTINLLKPFEDINKEKSKLKFPLTNLEVVTTIASNVAIFNFEKNNIPLYMNFCCFEAKDASMVLELVDNFIEKRGFEKLTTTPKESSFIYTVPCYPSASLTSGEEEMIMGEVELYIYYSLYLNDYRKKTNNTHSADTTSKEKIKYEVGKRFPDERYLNQIETTAAIINTAFFDVFCSFHEPTTEEIRLFRKGKLDVYLYENSNIPFLIFDMGFSFEVSIDVTKIPEEKQDDWLNSEANIITMFLVDTGTGIMQGIRTISIPPQFCRKN